MFDFAWSEIALIGVVALIAIGPKDMPVAIKAVTDMIKKARRMASEFQTHVDEMVKDANLGEVRDHINDIRTMDIKGRILRAVDGDGTLQRSLNDDPFKTAPVVPAMPPASAEPLPALEAVAADGTALDAPTLEAPALNASALDAPEPTTAPALAPMAEAAPAGPEAIAAPPAFIPPAAQLAAARPAPPAFIPPNAAQPRA